MFVWKLNSEVQNQDLDLYNERAKSFFHAKQLVSLHAGVNEKFTTPACQKGITARPTLEYLNDQLSNVVSPTKSNKTADAAGHWKVPAVESQTPHLRARSGVSLL